MSALTLLIKVNTGVKMLVYYLSGLPYSFKKEMKHLNSQITNFIKHDWCLGLTAFMSG